MGNDSPTPHPAPTPNTGDAITAVAAAESGQKLLQFLTRRLHLPQSLLHRWIRTGQIRLNGGRCKPFARVLEGDAVRLPPFALKLSAQTRSKPFAKRPDALPLPPLAGRGDGIRVFIKPAGLATHPGTGNADSLTTRLAAANPGAHFLPTPAHRLDKDTSGLLLVAESYAALAALQKAFAERRIIKEYLAWVKGRWNSETPCLLRHQMGKESADGRERMRVVDGRGREGICIVAPLKSSQQKSLLLIRLVTGRTHQIRLQLAELGHPVLGDGKYGFPRVSAGDRLMLHACRLVLPDGSTFSALPDWPGEYAVNILPALLPAALVSTLLETDAASSLQPRIGLQETTA